MKMCFSGFTRKAHLKVVKDCEIKSIVLDYTSKENRESGLWLDADFIILKIDLKSYFESIKDKFDEEEIRKKLTIKLKPFLKWAKEIEADRVAYPEIDFEYDYDSLWEDFDLIHLAMPTIKDVSQIKSLTSKYQYVAYSSDLDIEDLKGEVYSNINEYRDNKVKIHGWSRSKKSELVSGVFYSTDSNVWMGGSKYGNTYHYVGNMKMITYSAKRGRGKSVRKDFLTECLKYGVDPKSFQEDKQYDVDLWNLNQWKKFQQDCEHVGGYWSKRKIEKENKSIIKSDSLALDNVFKTTALANENGFGASLRSCNSCFVSPNCPLYEPDSQCRLSSDPSVSSPEDLQTLVNKVIQIQGERVLFASYVEKIQNNGLNPEVSKEVESLMRVMKDAKEILSPSDNEELTIKAKGSSVISRLFGGYGRSGGGGSRPSQSERIIDVSPLEKKEDE